MSRQLRYSTQEYAEHIALTHVRSGVTVAFVGLELTTGLWGVYFNSDPHATPVKRYRKLYHSQLQSNEPEIEIKSVTNWRRN